jgi:hypothetical protein
MATRRIKFKNTYTGADAAQIAIAAADEHVHLIDLSAMTLFDGNHFDAESTEYFGNQVFEILKTL